MGPGLTPAKRAPAARGWDWDAGGSSVRSPAIKRMISSCYSILAWNVSTCAGRTRVKPARTHPFAERFTPEPTLHCNSSGGS